jgi:benzoate-CoA ligase family protein
MHDGTPDHLNIAELFLDRRVAEGGGARPAIRTDTGTLSYEDVVTLSSKMAHLLAARGVRPEERVIVALPDTPAFVGALFGILRYGAVVVMVNPDLPSDQIRYFFEYTRARAAFVDETRLEAFTAATAGLPVAPTLIPMGTPDTDLALATASGDYPPFPSHRDDAAMWLFSGGTTGRPKAVVQTHRSYANTTKLYGQGVLGLTANDITMAVPKLFFGYATGSNLFFPFSVGASAVLFAERSTPEAVFDRIHRHRPTVLVNVPTMVQQMVAHPGAATADLSCLRLATSAGEALPVELHERWNRAFGVDLLDGLGTAEMWHIFISNRPGEVVPGTLGRVVPGFDVKLCDADGREVADGDVGALWVRGESRAIAYWQRMDDTMQAFRGEWYVSGDMLRRNADDTFVYCGRADDMLKVSGKWLSPGELENCLLQHADVREVAVVGVRNADGLVKPVAFVVSDAGSETLARELQGFAKSRLEPYKYPREVHFVEVLPRTHLGKVNRHALAQSAGHDERP